MDNSLDIVNLIRTQLDIKNLIRLQLSNSGQVLLRLQKSSVLADDSQASDCTSDFEIKNFTQLMH